MKVVNIYIYIDLKLLFPLLWWGETFILLWKQISSNRSWILILPIMFEYQEILSKEILKDASERIKPWN